MFLSVALWCSENIWSQMNRKYENVVHGIKNVCRDVFAAHWKNH